MFALPGICALMVFILARPQEYFTVLQRLPLLNIFSAMAVAGFVIDLKLRKLEPVPAPTFKWVCMFLGWCMLSDAIFTGEIDGLNQRHGGVSKMRCRPQIDAARNVSNSRIRKTRKGRKGCLIRLLFSPEQPRCPAHARQR
jgi:hypothetical protein